MDIIVTNTGPSALDGFIEIVDTAPTNIQMSFTGETHSNGLTFSPGSGVAVWSGTLSLGSGQSVTIAGDAIVSPCYTGTVTNQASAYAFTPCAHAEVFAPVDSFALTAPVLNFTVSKTQTPAAPGVGSFVTYRIVVTNTGQATLSEVYMTDTVAAVIPYSATGFAAPAGFNNPPTSTAVPEGNRYDWWRTGTPFLPGTSLTFTITGQVQAVCAQTTVSNTAFVTASAGSSCTGVTVSSNAPSFTVAGPVVSFTVSKTQVPAGGTLTAGTSVTYRIVLRNTGTATIENIVMTDTVSPLLVNQTTAGPGSPVVLASAGGTLYVWGTGSAGLGPNMDVTLTITGQVGAVCASATVMNQTQAIASAACPSTSQVVVSTPTLFTVAGPVLALTVSKTQTPAAPVLGGPVTWRIVVTNTGGATLDTIAVRDTVPTPFTNVTTAQPPAFSSPVLSQLPSGTRYVWSQAGLTMTPGMSYTFTISGQVGAVCAAAPVTATAVVTGSNACVSSGVTVPAGAVGFTANPPVLAMTVSRTQTPASPGIGGAVTYRVVSTNTGTATIQNILSLDTLS
ncbi:MAG: hypothetical protein AAB368_17200, partial [bacterium]